MLGLGSTLLLLALAQGPGQLPRPPRVGALRESALRPPAAERLLLVPWELLDRHTAVDGTLRLAVTVEAGPGGDPVVAGDRLWRAAGAPSWLPLEADRVRRIRHGAAASFRVLCDPAAGLLPGDDRSGSVCAELHLELPGSDAATASRLLGRVTLGPEADPIEDVEPWAAAVLDGRLGRGALGLSSRFQATLLWMLRPQDDWPRIGLDPTASRPTLRVETKLRRGAGFPLACWAERAVDAHGLDLAGALDDAMRAEGYSLSLDLHFLVPPDGAEPEEDRPEEWVDGFDPSTLLQGAGETVGELWAGAGVWNELRIRLREEDLARWSAGEVSSADLERAAEVSWNGTRLELPAAGSCR